MLFNRKNTRPSNKKEFIKYLKKNKYTMPHLNDNDTHEIVKEDQISMSVRKLIEGQTYAIIAEETGGVPIKSFVML